MQYKHASAIPEIKSGIAGYCIDDQHDAKVPNTIVAAISCNGRNAQNWVVAGDTIRHHTSLCLSVYNNGTAAGDTIVSNPCDNAAGQLWVSAIGGYENPATALCLAAPAKKAQLVLHSCSQLTTASELFAPSIWSKHNVGAATVSCATGSEGQKVACEAAKQWVLWQSGSVNHNTLLNNYSDGNGYEEWCADFVSYVYQQAGYPFTDGERGWDEYLATNIQYMGFSYHAAAGYTPQAGDVAFFNYPGGHVEIVAVGGAKPIFIYGDSGTTDPATGNGQMAENTITVDPSEGQVVYYLSPES